MSAVSRPAAPASVLQSRIVAVLRAKDAAEYPPIIDALLAGGVRAIELTLSTAGVLEGFADLRSRWDSTVDLGIGTIIDIDQCREALALGASFVVSPTMNGAIVDLCVESGVAVFPGGLTPTELDEGWRHGATAVKVFPAVTVGPGYIAQLRGPFPDIQIIPSGGVALADIPAWLDAGALAVSLGGPLLIDAFSGGDLRALTERSHRAVSVAAERLAAL